LVRRLDRATREALEHRDVPFPHLIRAVQPERDPHRLPLCHALLTLPDPAMTLRLIGAVVRPLPAADRPTLADLALTVTRLRPSLAGTLRHHHWRVGRPAAAGLHQQLQTLLTAAVDQPDRPIADLPLETPAQLRAAVRAADRIGAARPAQPVHQLVAERAARCPDAAAVDWDGGAISYRDLDARARALATRLRALGDVAGNAVAVRMSSGPWLVAASLAALYAGSHLTWLGPDDAGERGRAVLTDLAPACLLLDDDPARDPLASWFRRECGGRVINLAMLGTAGATGAADCTIDPEQIAYVAYTSGTTGRPKGIAQSHGALAQFVSWMAEALELNDASRVAQWAALEHDPSLCEVFATLAAGGTLCPVPPRIRAHPEKLVDWLARERITMLQTVPSFARELLAVLHDRGSAEPLSALRQLVLMGEALPATLADAIRATLPWTRLTNIYGPTETIAATWHQVVGPVLSGTVPIGRSLPGRQVLVVDEQDQPCPTGIVGEIVVRSPYAVRSYLGGAAGGAAFRPVSAVTDPPVPCYRTGDLGRRRFDGLLEFAGRRDFQVKLAGHRVELAEVEAALADHESVADCAVSAVTDSDGLVERLVAYVAPRSLRHREPATAAQWRAHLRHRFGHAMVRVSFVTVSRIPRNLAGKVDRQRLPDPRRVVEPAPRPRSQLEEAMAGIWSKVLASPPTDVEQTFFAAGGHSSLLPRLVTLIHDQFGVEVPIAACYANPSLAGMSMVVAAAGTRRYATAAERPVEGDRPPGQ
jgi:amino acid adenylation domain-containing protein